MKTAWCHVVHLKSLTLELEFWAPVTTCLFVVVSACLIDAQG